MIIMHAVIGVQFTLCSGIDLNSKYYAVVNLLD